MFMSLNTAIAKELGVNEGVLFVSIKQEIARSKQKGMGDWIKKSAREIAEEHPFLSRRQVERAVDNLVKNGYLEKDFRSPDKLDRASWFSLTQKGVLA